MSNRFNNKKKITDPKKKKLRYSYETDNYEMIATSFSSAQSFLPDHHLIAFSFVFFPKKFYDFSRNL